MKARLAILLLGPLVCACQSSIPFYTRPADEPEWFKAKEAEAQAKGYPSAQAIPPNPENLPSMETMKQDLVDVECAGARVRNNKRSVLGKSDTGRSEAFVKKALEENTVPPLIDDVTRHEDESKPEKPE